MGGIVRAAPFYFVSIFNTAHIFTNETYFITGTLPLEVIPIKIGFIGAGKVGFSVGKLFKINSLDLSGYYSRNFHSAEAAAEFTNSSAFYDIEALIKCSDIIFITVPDDEIYKTYLNIKQFDLSNKILCHTSGSLSSQIFSDIDKMNAFSYSIHPIFPVSNKYESYKYLKDSLFTIEGSKERLDYIIELFRSINLNIIPITSTDKSLYHLASVTVSNLFLALLKRSCDYLSVYGFSEKEAISMLYPLITSNVNSALENGIDNSLTGPVQRNDIETIKHHLEHMPAEHVDTYCDLSKELISIAKRKNSEIDYSYMEKLLGGM
ncbi:Rossmann-like and DUF2520 domain-containing protein [Clostridium oryzae]|uniref:Rossmann-like domain protein n=1 Tax=Clostridium oryzae TaxID=1450648 RepID=A0A1V4IN17_9CLOT|nr:Rossmann-like and DUF2520 domain-containing protein [Clostridium oryzae]OPJ61296.1 Rossmann-like domain protein [Clostridium oryzae]